MDNNGAGTTTLTAWYAIIDIWCGATTTAYAGGALSTNFTNTGSYTTNGGGSYTFMGSLDWTADQTLKVWGTASTSGSIELDVISIDYFPTP